MKLFAFDYKPICEVLGFPFTVYGLLYDFTIFKGLGLLNLNSAFFNTEYEDSV